MLPFAHRLNCDHGFRSEFLKPVGEFLNTEQSSCSCYIALGPVPMSKTTLLLYISGGRDFFRNIASTLSRFNIPTEIFHKASSLISSPAPVLTRASSSHSVTVA